ncbi:hypothetical protein CHUAL_013177 [Chamberlinius hualienensis]
MDAVLVVGPLILSASSQSFTYFTQFTDSRWKCNFSYRIGNYKLLLINGNMDLVVNPVTVADTISKLQWKGATLYDETERVIWRVNKSDVKVAGYATTNSVFSEVMVRNAGHMVPYDQPREALDALNRFINNRNFSL